MAWCIQCGETIALETERCPTCGRLVGASSIGAAQERRLNAGSRRGLVVAVAVVTVAVMAWLGVRFLSDRHGVSNDQRVTAARAARRATVRVTRGTVSAGGVVLRTSNAGVLVATPLEGAAGTLVEVAAGDDAKLRGVIVARGTGRALASLALVLVPDAPPQLEPAAVVRGLSPDAPVLAPNANVTLATEGAVLSFDEDGVLVHDAPLSADARGFGLWSASGRLAALAVTDAALGDHTAFSAERLAARVLVHSVTIPPGSTWIDPGVPLPPGASVAAIARGEPDALSIRFGDRGTVAKAKAPWPSLALATVGKMPEQPLQLGRANASEPLQVTLVSLAQLR